MYRNMQIITREYGLAMSKMLQQVDAHTNLNWAKTFRLFGFVEIEKEHSEQV